MKLKKKKIKIFVHFKLISRQLEDLLCHRGLAQESDGHCYSAVPMESASQWGSELEFKTQEQLEHQLLSKI